MGSADLSGAPLVTHIVERLAAAPARCGGSRVLLLDGRSGSGKSTLADRVLAALPDVVPVRIDALYPGWSGLLAGAELVAGDILPGLAAGRDVTVPSWDWYADRPGPALTYPAGHRYVVVEGVGAALTASRAFASLVVWLDGDEELRRQRAVERDGPDTAAHWQHWADQEREMIERHAPQAAADLVARLG